jgi:hypothetical protein
VGRALIGPCIPASLMPLPGHPVAHAAGHQQFGRIPRSVSQIQQQHTVFVFDFENFAQASGARVIKGAIFQAPFKICNVTPKVNEFSDEENLRDTHS